MPQPFNNAVITNAGATLLTRAQAGEISIEFTRIATGNGEYTAEEKRFASLQERSALKSLKNSYLLSSVSVFSEHSVKVTTLITNYDFVEKKTIVTEGYYINEIGLFAKPKGEGEDAEVLYSVAVTSGDKGDFMPPYNGYNPAQITQDYYATVSNSAEVTINDAGAVVTIEKLNAAQQKTIDLVYQQSTGYTDQKIADLINGAPSTLDTLGEIADAMRDNADVVEALNSAIGTKATQAEMESLLGATNQRFGGMSFVLCTQAEYDALGTGRPSDTIYIIVG